MYCYYTFDIAGAVVQLFNAHFINAHYAISFAAKVPIEAPGRWAPNRVPKNPSNILASSLSLSLSRSLYSRLLSLSLSLLRALSLCLFLSVTLSLSLSIAFSLSCFLALPPCLPLCGKRVDRICGRYIARIVRSSVGAACLAAETSCEGTGNMRSDPSRIRAAFLIQRVGPSPSTAALSSSSW